MPNHNVFCRSTPNPQHINDLFYETSCLLRSYIVFSASQLCSSTGSGAALGRQSSEVRIFSVAPNPCHFWV